MPGTMTKMETSVIVCEKSAYWGPELQRRFLDLKILVRECRSINELDENIMDTDASLVLIDVSAWPQETVTWITRNSLENMQVKLIACLTDETRDIEWTLREAGFSAVIYDDTPATFAAKECLRLIQMKRR